MKHVNGVWGYVFLFALLNLIMNFVITISLAIGRLMLKISVPTDLEMAIKVFALILAAFIASGRFKIIEQRSATESETLRIAMFGFLIVGGLILLIGLGNAAQIMNDSKGAGVISPKFKWYSVLFAACFGSLFLFFGPLLKYRKQ